MRSNTGVPGEAPNKIEGLHWIRAIFYLHFAVVYLSIVLFWCYLFYHEYFPFTLPKKSDLQIFWRAQDFLFWGMPTAILFTGLLGRVKLRTWIPYLILDLAIGSLSYVWISVLSYLIVQHR